jgi:hypothetical protein
MTFEEFKKNCEIAISKKPPFMRVGQTIFNLLAKTWPNKADKICDSGELDCYFKDDNVANLFSHLESVWNDEYPN